MARGAAAGNGTCLGRRHRCPGQGDTLLLAASTTVWRTPLASFAPQVLISSLSDAGQDAFLALRGYKVVRLRFDAAGRPQFEDFVTGFLDAERLVQWGRPVGLAWLSDGSMLVSDDSNGVIWRVSYGG